MDGSDPYKHQQVLHGFRQENKIALVAKTEKLLMMSMLKEFDAARTHEESRGLSSASYFTGPLRPKFGGQGLRHRFQRRAGHERVPEGAEDVLGLGCRPFAWSNRVSVQDRANDGEAQVLGSWGCGSRKSAPRRIGLARGPSFFRCCATQVYSGSR